MGKFNHFKLSLLKEKTRMPPLFAMCLFTSLTVVSAQIATAQTNQPGSHGIAMYGQPMEPADFKHLSYANPDAPQGGRITYGVIGSFDSLNPFILKSMRTTARGLWDPEFGSNMYFEPLMVRSRNEPFTLYGLIAKSVTMAEDRSWIEFHLNPDARWHDGKPVTADDVIFTYELLTQKGRPPFSSRMKRIEKIEKTPNNSVKFTFNEKSNREYPLIVAGFTPILPKHAIDIEAFDGSTLKPIIGSGPYKLAEINPGQKVVYKKDPNYWGKDLPVQQGFFNFDEIAVEYFTQSNTRFEAFKKGIVDVYQDGDPAHWERAYDFAAITDGTIVKKEILSGDPPSMLGFIFNTRRAVFAQKPIRQALSAAFDFETINKNLFFDAYTRTNSFWHGSELSSVGKPADEKEKLLLAKFSENMQADILDGSWLPSKTDGSGNNRKTLRAVFKLLKTAGYKRDGSTLKSPDGSPVTFEIMTRDTSEEKLALAFKATLSKLGIEITVRTVDDAQYQKRLQTFNYDMIIGSYSASLSPGIEQTWRWGSDSKSIEGSFNYAGASQPAIDQMIKAMLAAREREDFVAAVRAMDRVLLSSHYVIPLYHLAGERIAHSAKLSFPENPSLYGNQFPVWWHKGN